MADSSTHNVVEVETIDDGLFILTLERNHLAFDPGDCVALHTDNGKSRPYSIASGNGEDELRFLIREMEGGEVSPWLAQRKAGDGVGVSSPFGWFRPGQHADGGPSVFIATGTGLAPFLSYRETFPNQPPTAVLHGVRQQAAAAGLDRMDGWCDTRLAVSREAMHGHHHGHVTELLADLPTAANTHYYLCGLESMVRDCSDRLQQCGVNLFNIHREVFFHG
jgi:NAD(P)H-flavin reductase